MNTLLQKRSFQTLLGALLIASALPLNSCASTSSQEALFPTDRLFNAYVLSPTANADGGSSGLSYYIDATNNTAVVSQGSCTEAAVTIPATYNTTYTVVGVNVSGFANDSSLTSVTFASPTAITMIGSQAFLNTKLTSFSCPVNVAAINPSSFMNCRSLTSFSFTTGSTCTAILDHAFTGCVSLVSSALPTGLVSIGDAAYQGCLSLVRAVFPLSFTTLGEAAYEDCVNLGLIYFQTNISSIGAFAFKNCKKAWAFFSGDLPSGYSATGQWWNYLYGGYSGTTSVPTANSTGTPLTTAGDFVPVYTNKSTLNYTDGFYYTKYKSTDPAKDYDIVIILYNGTTAANGAGTVDLTVPNTITDDDGTHRVIGIDNSAFASHTELATVTFLSNLQFINDKAFYNCSNLTSIGLSGATSLTTIGASVFTGDAPWTGLTSITIPAAVTSIGSKAFYYNQNVASLTFVGASDGTSKLKTIGSYAFQYCGVNFTASNSTNGAVVLPATLTSVATTAFSDARFIYSLTFKSTGALAIGSYAFYSLYYLTSVSLPSSATSITIGGSAFALGGLNGSFNGKTLHSFYIPSNVTSMGSKVFNARIRLTVYCAASSKPTKFDSAFASMDGQALGDSVSRGALPVYYNVGTGTGKRNLLHYSNATNGEFDFLETTANAATSIVTRYYYEGNASVSLTPTVPSSVTINSQANTPTALGDNAFIFSSINGTVNAGYQGMWSDNATSCLSKVTLPNTIVTIGDYCFTTSTVLTNVGNGTDYTFPTALTTLGASAFTYCGLTKAYLPAVTSISTDNPFLGCFQLAVLQINSDATTAGLTYYSNNNNIYKASTTSDYAELVLGADGASSFNGSATDTIAWGCTTIDGFSYRGQRKVTAISIPYTVTAIGQYFMDSIGSAVDASGTNGTNALTSVRFYTSDSTGYPSSLCTTIGQIAFWGCKSLVTMEFPSSLTTINNEAFSGCSALAYCPTTSSGTGTQGLLDLSGTGISTLGDSAFKGCSSLTKIVLPNALTQINPSAFSGCSKVTSVTLGNSVTTVNGSGFSGCSSLASISFPSTLTSLADNAFSGDTKLTSVTFNNNQTSSLTLSGSKVDNKVDYNSCFRNCSGLTSLVLPKGVIFPSSNCPFWGCSGLMDSAAATGTTKGVFLNMTGTEYSSAWGGSIPSGWNYYKAGTPVTYACHATTSAEAVCSADTTMKYWHYVSGVPTIGVGADS